MPRKKTTGSTPIGQKIKQARTKKKRSLSALANDTGFSVDYLKELEACKKIPSVGTLLQIARSLEINSDALLHADGGTSEERRNALTVRTENYAYTTLTPEAGNKHIKAFKVHIDAGKTHVGVGYQHDGEEFVYVLIGRIEVSVGDNPNILETGDCLHFNSGIRHNIRNIGNEDAEMLVVIYGP